MHPELVIPQYITKVQLSKKQRTKYYTKKSKIPKTKQKYKFKNGYLVDENNKKIIANPKTAGKPKYEVLSGNKLKAGFGSPHIRAKIVKELKKFYRPFVQEYIDKHGPITEFPLRIEWDVYTTVEEEKPNWDADNLDFYFKYFQDCLFETTCKYNDYAKYKGKKLKQLIPNDTVEYITFPSMPKIIPIDNWDDRKFVFRFYKDNRPELKRKPWI